MKSSNRRRPVSTPSRPTPARQKARQPVTSTSATPMADGRAVARVVLLYALTLILLGWTVVAWPRLTLPFSSMASIVDTLDTDVLYDGGIGLTAEQQQEIRGAIGTRPITMVYLPADGSPDASDVCKAVSSRLPQVQLVIVRGPDGAYGCTGDKVPVIPDNGGDLRGFPYELRISMALGLETDPVAKAQGVALVHDSMVRGGMLGEAERSFRTPWSQVLFTVLIVVGVLAGILLVLSGLRWVARYLRVKRNRAAEQDQLRDDLDDALAEVAMIVVAQIPTDPRAPRGSDIVAAEYVDLLGRAQTASGGWAGLLLQARKLLGHRDPAAARDANQAVRS